MAGLRARKKAETKQEIVEAALTLFEKRGYDETTIEDIADAAAVSPRTVFRYFTSKEDLVFMGQDDENRRIAAAVANAPRRNDLVTSFMEGVHTVLFGEHAAPTDHILRAQKLMAKVPALRDAQARLLKETERWLTKALTPAGMSRRQAAQRELFAAVALAALDVTLRRWLAAGGKGTPELELEEVESLLRRAFPELEPPRASKR